MIFLEHQLFKTYLVISYTKHEYILTHKCDKKMNKSEYRSIKMEDNNDHSVDLFAIIRNKRNID